MVRIRGSIAVLFSVIAFVAGAIFAVTLSKPRRLSSGDEPVKSAPPTLQNQAPEKVKNKQRRKFVAHLRSAYLTGFGSLASIVSLVMSLVIMWYTGSPRDNSRPPSVVDVQVQADPAAIGLESKSKSQGIDRIAELAGHREAIEGEEKSLLERRRFLSQWQFKRLFASMFREIESTSPAARASEAQGRLVEEEVQRIEAVLPYLASKKQEAIQEIEELGREFGTAGIMGRGA